MSRKNGNLKQLSKPSKKGHGRMPMHFTKGSDRISGGKLFLPPAKAKLHGL